MAKDRQFLPFTPNGEATERQAIQVKCELGLSAEVSVDPYEVLPQVPARLIDASEFAKAVPANVRVTLFETHRSEWSAIGWGESPTTKESLILLNPTHHPRRQKASLMEEVVHIVLDHPKTELCLNGNGDASWVRPYDAAVEDEAFCVGAACIIPWPELFTAVSRLSETVSSIAKRYGVSEDYVLYRIKRSGLARVYGKRQRGSRSA